MTCSVYGARSHGSDTDDTGNHSTPSGRLVGFWVMEPDTQARTLGYKSASDWLDTAVPSPAALVEYDQIFWSGRAITKAESRLIEAIDGPTAREWVMEEWPHKRLADCMAEWDDWFSTYVDALDALDRLRRPYWWHRLELL